MGAELIIAPEAEGDLDEAYAWYEKQRVGLGEDFLSNVDACISLLCRVPNLGTIVHKSFRRALVRRFPYAVFYEHVDGVLTVYCVSHTARDPDKWRKRLS
ncbi:MAG TPA: type II toxin-antitoxin system RelE/ParE family toxin [Gemmataceae bacterium]|nr:type II toxin-antitoxin system RelE/ParE family toxin [Gemmataceae bacterium]